MTADVVHIRQIKAHDEAFYTNKLENIIEMGMLPENYNQHKKQNT